MPASLTCHEDYERKYVYGSQYGAWHSAQKMFAVKIITSISHGDESKHFFFEKKVSIKAK